MKIPKYIVQKIESESDHIGPKVRMEVLEEGTYFVIRSQDVFGAAALYGYAHLLQTGLELDRIRPRLSDEECGRLERLAEDVVKLAHEWQKRGDAKIPD